MRFVAGLLLGLCAAGVGVRAEAPGVRAALVRAGERKPAPAFVLSDAAGRPAKMADYRGRVLLLNFWATWCGGCREEMPWFQEFEDQLGKRRMGVLGVSVDEEGWAVVRPFLAKSALRYRMAVADQAMAERYAVESLPVTLVIDRKGRVAARYGGLVDREDLGRKVRAVLGE